MKLDTPFFERRHGRSSDSATAWKLGASRRSSREKCMAIRCVPFTACIWPTKVAKRSLTASDGWQAATTACATGVNVEELADAPDTVQARSAKAAGITAIRRMA